MLFKEGLVGAPIGLGDEIRRRDVEDILESVEDAELAGDVFGVLARAVGEDQLAAGQFLDRLAEAGIELDDAWSMSWAKSRKS